MIIDHIDDDDNGVRDIVAGDDDDVADDDDYDIDDDDSDDMDGMWFVAGPTRSGRCHRTNLRRRQNLLKMLTMMMRAITLVMMNNFQK